MIVTTYTKERANDLIECIHSLQQQTLKPDEVILVLDNPELESFYSSVISSQVKIVNSAGSWGSSYARNTGLMNATGEVVAFIDDDAVAAKDWLMNLVQDYNSADVVGVTGFVTPVWAKGRPDWFPEELDWVVGCSHKGLPIEKASVRNPIGCNMSFRKEIFGKAGYFQPRLGAQPTSLLMRSEEAELSMRILKSYPRSQIVFEPTAIVYHKVPMSRTSIRYLMRRSFYEGFSKRIFQNYVQTADVLSTEENYLKYLVRVAVVSRLKQIPKSRSCSELLVIGLSIMMVGIGYIAGHFSRLRSVGEPDPDN